MHYKYLFFLYFGEKVPVRRTGAYRHKNALTFYEHMKPTVLLY